MITSTAIAVEPPHREPRLLFVSRAERPPEHDLSRARTWAEQLGAELYMLRVLREQTVATEDVSGTLAVRGGEFVQTVAAHAGDRQPVLIVLPHGVCSGSEAVALARMTRRPVLVARATASAPGAGTILATTDLMDVRFSLLALAGQLGSRLQVRVVAMHNLERQRVPPSSRMSAGSVDSPDTRTPSATTFQELVPVTCELRIHSLVLTDVADTVDAILREARLCAADVVMVGAAVRQETRARGRVAAHVVNLCPSSVLIVPWLREPVRPVLAAAGSRDDERKPQRPPLERGSGRRAARQHRALRATGKRRSPSSR
jgi:nucleotide-binding universal stress UspA family protein